MLDAGSRVVKKEQDTSSVLKNSEYGWAPKHREKAWK
jgi:hypothetical protein